MYLDCILLAFKTMTVAPTATSASSQIFLFIPVIPLSFIFLLVGLFSSVYFIRQKKLLEAVCLMNTMLLAIIILLLLIRL